MIQLSDFGLEEKYWEDEAFIGRIIYSNKQYYKVITSRGEFPAILKGSAFYRAVYDADLPVVGDFVQLREIDQGERYLIEKTLERKSKINRGNHDKLMKEQLIAVNVDIVFVCISANQNFNLNRLERYLYAAMQEQLRVIAVLTKADLAENSNALVEQITARFPMVETLKLSMYDASSIDQLRSYLHKGITAVLMGSSGVGKSTLINLLAKQDVMKTSAVNEKHDKGMHTTTSRHLIKLPEGGCIIDTPGMRTLKLWDHTDETTFFQEIQELAKQCKYHDCTHTIEVDCAVLQAIEQGILSEEQLGNYQKLMREQRFRERTMRSGYYKERREKTKAIETAKWNSKKRTR